MVGAMKYFVGLILAVGLVAGATVVGYNRFQDSIRTTGGSAGGGGNDNGAILGEPPSTVVQIPPQGAVIVEGTVTEVHMEGGRTDTASPLRLPLTITTPTRGEGSGASLRQVSVDGQLTDVEWDGGTPLGLNGDGGILTGPITLDLDPSSTTVAFGIEAHGFAPGTYQLSGPVAVGTGGLARPADALTFTAGTDAAALFRGEASTTFDTRDGAFKGPGKLALTGDLTLRHPDRTTTAAKSVVLDSGPFTLKVTVDAQGVRIQALLQGQVTTG